MRKTIFLILTILLMEANLFAQSALVSRYVEVTVNKTFNLIFPSAIASVDRGSERIIVQKATPNVLRVKADSIFSDTTNLTVITEDGRLYSFLVGYSTSPTTLTLDLGIDNKIVRDTALQALASAALSVRNKLYGIHYGSGNVLLSLAGIYTNGEVLVCKLRIENNSALSFRVGQIRAFVVGTQVSKRRSVHEAEISILLTQQDFLVVRENGYSLLAVVIPKAALAEGQALKIEVAEKSADRHLTLKVPNRYLLKAFLIKQNNTL